MTTFTRVLTAITLAAATTLGTIAGVGTAGADSSSPTIGDSIEYYFYSDVQVNEYVTWFNANNDMDDMTNPKLPRHSKKNDVYWAANRVTARSTYQLTGSSFQTSGYYASCSVYVNGVKTSTDTAYGHYAVAVC